MNACYMFIAIVPAFNEEKNIAAVVSQLLTVVDQVIVVDDCSSDQTQLRATQAGAVVLRHALNRGQGAALETGHVYARKHKADYIIHFDGDDQFDVADVLPALHALQKNNADVLFGSRFLDERSHLPFSKKYIILPLGRLLLDRWFFGIRLSDAHIGFRILNKKALDLIQITQDRMAHATQIPALVRQHQLSYIEFPVKVTYHEYGQGIKAIPKIMYDLFIGRFLT